MCRPSVSGFLYNVYQCPSLKIGANGAPHERGLKARRRAGVGRARRAGCCRLLDAPRTKVARLLSLQRSLHHTCVVGAAPHGRLALQRSYRLCCFCNRQRKPAPSGRGWLRRSSPRTKVARLLSLQRSLHHTCVVGAAPHGRLALQRWYRLCCFCNRQRKPSPSGQTQTYWFEGRLQAGKGLTAPRVQTQRYDGPTRNACHRGPCPCAGGCAAM